MASSNPGGGRYLVVVCCKIDVERTIPSAQYPHPDDNGRSNAPAASANKRHQRSQ